MTPSQAWDKFVESLPKGAQQNIRDSVQLGISHTFDAFNAGFEAGKAKPRCNPHPKAPHGFPVTAAIPVTDMYASVRAGMLMRQDAVLDSPRGLPTQIPFPHPETRARTCSIERTKCKSK